MTTVVLIGRPNVGKSTLFNLLSKGARALVAPIAGVTRDVRSVDAGIGDLAFTLLDTAGLVDGGDDLADQLNVLTSKAMQRADVVMFVLDGKEGLLPADEALARKLHQLNKTIVPIVSKADTKSARDVALEVVALGFGEPVVISVEHRLGLDDLETALMAHITPVVVDAAEVVAEDDVPPVVEDEVFDEHTSLPEEVTGPAQPITLSIVGRPNVGKSTLVNQLLQDERMLTGDLAGLTRESLLTPWTYNGQEYALVDTPGLRKKANVHEALEQMSTRDTVQALTAADVVILVLDASRYDQEMGNWQVVEQQDAKIAALALDRGKALVVALNKWDCVTEKDACLEESHYQLGKKVAALREMPLIPLSATRGKGMDALMNAVQILHAKQQTRVGTGKLNRLLEEIITHKPPPLSKGRSVKLKYITQVAVSPPTFIVWGNRVETLPASYQRFVLNTMKEALGLVGVPVKLLFRQSDNPYNH